MKLGDRIKRYESVTHGVATARTPVLIRVDGRAFHTYTRGMERPFDKKLTDSMVSAARYVAEDMQGFKLAYIQSDEVTFCITDYDSNETQGWFDYDLSKIISISASMMSVAFNAEINNGKLAVFDSRAFNVPQGDVANAFLWRAKDWERNSLQMYCRAHFSHKELHSKRRPDMHEMLHRKGLNWATDLLPRERNGTFLVNTDDGIIENNETLPTYESIRELISDRLDYSA